MRRRYPGTMGGVHYAQTVPGHHGREAYPGIYHPDTMERGIPCYIPPGLPWWERYTLYIPPGYHGGRGVHPVYTTRVPWWPYYHPVYTLLHHPGYTPHVHHAMPVLVSGACV